MLCVRRSSVLEADSRMIVKAFSFKRVVNDLFREHQPDLGCLLPRLGALGRGGD